jgi:hypothetical protein
LGGLQGSSETRYKSNRQKHDWELLLEDLKKPDAQPEIDPLGSEHVRFAARKEVRRRQLENKNTRVNDFMERAGPSQAPEPTSQESEITRLEAMMDEQMKDVFGAVDKIESEAKSWLWRQQYRDTIGLTGPSQEPANESSQPQPSMRGLSTCYNWDWLADFLIAILEKHRWLLHNISLMQIPGGVCHQLRLSEDTDKSRREVKSNQMPRHSNLCSGSAILSVEDPSTRLR